MFTKSIDRTVERWYTMVNERRLTALEIKAIESVINKNSRAEVTLDHGAVNISEVKRKRVKIEDEPRSKR